MRKKHKYMIGLSAVLVVLFIMKDFLPFHLIFYYKSEQLAKETFGENGPDPNLKKILLWNSFFSWRLWNFERLGQHFFKKYNCPENRCVVTTALSQVSSSDIVLFHTSNLCDYGSLPQERNPNQLWILFMLESPINTYISWCTLFGNKRIDTTLDNIFNGTMTYHSESLIYFPYGKKVQRDVFNDTAYTNVSAGKSKQVLWFVSNCHTEDTKLRLKYAKELSKYIDVDIYGACGKHDPCKNVKYESSCKKKLWSKYKFYLAFESSRCNQYITEKLWVALSHNIVPIAMGTTVEDYRNVAPPNSFIHVDQFKGPKFLAEYLHYLDKNDDKYNNYFEWKKMYSADSWKPVVDGYCQLCSLAHSVDRKFPAVQISQWWSRENQCHAYSRA